MDGSRRHRRRRDRWAWAGVFALISVPALAIGGVLPELVPAFLVGVALLWWRLLGGPGRTCVVPRYAALGLLLCGVTLLQWAPLPLSARGLLSPELSARVVDALARETGHYDFWGSLSPSPGDTGLEASRLLALTLFFAAAAQLPWRVVAVAVACCGSVVALIGLAQAGFGVSSILGVYRPVDIDPAETGALLTTFVNPNHQSGLFLLGLFAAGGLLVDASGRDASTRDPDAAVSSRERVLVAAAAVLLQTFALVLSRSRAALLVGALVAPLAIGFAWFGGQESSRARGVDARSRWRWRWRALTLTLYAGVIAALLRCGAWEEVRGLMGGGGEPLAKLRVVRDALALISLSPWVGIGRGAFLDVFPAVDSQPGRYVHTHLESAPVAMIVEWGVIIGTVAVLGLAVYWVDAIRQAGSRARRVTLCGLLALALQSLGDFSLEFLGVAAPACALAGALAGGPGWTLDVRAARRWIVGLTLIGVALAMWSAPRSWTKRAVEDARIRAGEDAVEASVVRTRPLDGVVHGVIARRAGARGEWAEALLRARVAARLRPGSADAWLLLASAEERCVDRCGGDMVVARDASARALRLISAPLEPSIVEYLLRRYPEPRELAPLLPAELSRWLELVASIGARDPVYGGALVATRGLKAREPELLALQASLALQAENAALALHAARLLRAREPGALRGVTLSVQALRRFKPAREREIQALLEEALTGDWDARERGELEELLVRSLLATGTAADRSRARARLAELLERPASRATLRRRRELARALAGE
ncbi:MAG: hypothetical protein H6713_10470 [Myxococcales bacterium]|nr:hypothetical protein [Myxococcales bacterium]